MALTIKWTLQAEKGLAKVLIYLEEHWTVKEILKLETAIKRVILQISLNPDLYPASETYKEVRKALIDKNNYLVYRFNEKKQIIEIINFRGTKQKTKY